ncbi:MAG: protein-glutamate O-methyltransferase CheR [Desulfuromonadales bacterium]|nr:protein-glutamate O-methyltransferase CheR [Desulfuromonadales bacterium]
MTFDEFLRQACPPLDLEWRKYRRRAARHRVQKRLRELGLTDYAAYLERLQSDPREAASLADRMRISVTRFFREQDRWQLLAEAVLPCLLAARKPDTPLRAWSAGCAGGEEPYTLAILWRSQILPHYPDRQLQILATDIDPPSLQRAEVARYPPGELREVPTAVRESFFRQHAGFWSPLPEVTAMVQFTCHNLLTDPSPGTFDLICCRYLPFTYFRCQRRLNAASTLHQALAADGALMIGGKEDLGSATPLFTPWPQAPGFFRRGG